MGTSDILLGGGGGGKPVMDWHCVQELLALLLGMLHTKKTGISSGCLGLWLMCTCTLLLLISSLYVEICLK